MIRTLKISVLFFSSLIFSCNLNKTPSTKNLQIIKPSRIIYLIDGKSVSVEEVNKGFEKGYLKVKGSGGTNDSREALLNFGEKYRYGINIFVTISKQ